MSDAPARLLRACSAHPLDGGWDPMRMPVTVRRRRCRALRRRRVLWLSRRSRCTLSIARGFTGTVAAPTAALTGLAELAARSARSALGVQERPVLDPRGDTGLDLFPGALERCCPVLDDGLAGLARGWVRFRSWPAAGSDGRARRLVSSSSPQLSTGGPLAVCFSASDVLAHLAPAASCLLRRTGLGGRRCWNARLPVVRRG